MSSPIAKTFQIAEQTLREGKRACDKFETERRLRFLEFFHSVILPLEKMGVPWQIRDYVFESGTVVKK